MNCKGVTHWNRQGQAYTEYLVILVWFVFGLFVTSTLVGFQEIRDIFFRYYAGLAEYLNLPFF